MSANTSISNLRKFILFSLILATLSGCVFPGVYKINVQQGNIISPKDLAQVTTGMSRRQVHRILGTPSLTNSLDRSVDSYLYTYQKAGGKIRQQRIKIEYDTQDKVTMIGAKLLDDTPAY